MNTQTLEKELIGLRRGSLKNFSDFRKYYFASINVIPDAAFHRTVCRVLGEMNEKRGQKWALAAPRGCGKSEIITTQYVLYSLCRANEKFIVIISNTKEQATKFLDSIKYQLQSNVKLNQDYPEVCETSPKPPRWTQHQIETKNRIKIIALGAGQQIRGVKYQNVRPSLMIIDDVEANVEFFNPEARRESHDWFTKAVLKAGTPETNIILTGTIHHTDSLLAQFTSPDANQEWRKSVGRMIQWPERMDIWEGWQKIYHGQLSYKGQIGPDAARALYADHKEEMRKGAAVLWPHKYSLIDLMTMREEEGHASFDSEMQNQPVNPKDCLFNVDEFHFWTDEYDSEAQLLRALGRNAEFFGACDPSLGRDTQRGDYSAIVNVVRCTKTGRIYVLDADLERCLPDHILTKALVYFQARSFTRFAFESNQFQEYLVDHLRNMANTGRFYTAIEKIHNTKNKQGRITNLQTFVKDGTIQFSRKHLLLLDQAKYFPKGAHDDGLDALEMAVSLAMTKRGLDARCSLITNEPSIWEQLR